MKNLPYENEFYLHENKITLFGSMASHFQPRFETDSRASQKSPIIYCVGEPSKGFSEQL